MKAFPMYVQLRNSIFHTVEVKTAEVYLHLDEIQCTIKFFFCLTFVIYGIFYVRIN